MSDSVEIPDSKEEYPSDDIDKLVKPDAVVLSWLPIIKRLSINIFIPFINGIMLGFGEIIAHELGLFCGWRSARPYDPTVYPATNPRARRKWLFGLW